MIFSVDRFIELSKSKIKKKFKKVYLYDEYNNATGRNKERRYYYNKEIMLFLKKWEIELTYKTLIHKGIFTEKELSFEQFIKLFYIKIFENRYLCRFIDIKPMIDFINRVRQNND